MPRITIIIKNLNDDKKSIVVDTSDTISRGKSLYGNLNAQWLYDGEVLNNEKTFSDYKVEDGDYIISNDRTKKITIYIKDMNTSKSIVVGTSDTISKGKSLYGNGNAQWKLDGQVLRDEKTFSDYNVEDGDYIQSNERSRGG